MTRARRGLTLIEVLVATVVCGAGVAAVALALAGTLKAEGASENLDRGVHHLDILLHQLDGQELQLQDDTGDFSELGAPDLEWEIKVANADVENLQEVTATVRWTERGAPRELTVERYFFVDPREGGVQ